MNLNFDFTNVTTTEFGVGKEENGGDVFVAVPVDNGVQGAVVEMAATTWSTMSANAVAPEQYSPSEKHAPIEHLYLALDDDMAAAMRNLHEAVNLSLDSNALLNASHVFCYFARMVDSSGRHLTALRRAAQFKGILKSRLIRWVTDALRLVPDNVFKLDSDFDLLVDSNAVHILRPSGFEFAGKLQPAIVAAVPGNVRVIQKDLPFVDFTSIGAYAVNHPRAARYLASIRSLKQAKGVDRRALRAECRQTGVTLAVVDGKIVVEDAHVMDFLEVLDRRRYKVELVKGSPERFRASSRQKIASPG